MDKKKILFVCLGNICRSPLAEGIMLQYIKEKELPLIVDSAAIESYHIGEHPDRRTIKNALKHNFDISHLVARQFKIKDFDEFDKIYVMDSSHYNYLKRLAPDKNIFQQKVDYLMNIVYPNQNIEIPDPYYGTEEDFETVFQMIHSACQKLVENYSILQKTHL